MIEIEWAGRVLATYTRNAEQPDWQARDCGAGNLQQRIEQITVGDPAAGLDSSDLDGGGGG